jgi:hypothetical protein
MNLPLVGKSLGAESTNVIVHRESTGKASASCGFSLSFEYSRKHIEQFGYRYIRSFIVIMNPHGGVQEYFFGSFVALQSGASEEEPKAQG